MVAGASGSRPGNKASTLSIIPYQMKPGDEKVVAERIHALLSKPPKFDDPAPPQSPATSSRASGTFASSSAGAPPHTPSSLEQEESKLKGTHRGEFYSGDLAGSISGESVKFMSAMRVHGTRLTYDFAGKVEGDRLAGTVDLGEYGVANFTAQRHQYRTGSRRG